MMSVDKSLDEYEILINEYGVKEIFDDSGVCHVAFPCASLVRTFPAPGFVLPPLMRNPPLTERANPLALLIAETPTSDAELVMPVTPVPFGA